MVWVSSTPLFKTRAVRRSDSKCFHFNYLNMWRRAPNCEAHCLVGSDLNDALPVAITPFTVTRISRQSLSDEHDS